MSHNRPWLVALRQSGYALLTPRHQPGNPPTFTPTGSCPMGNYSCRQRGKINVVDGALPRAPIWKPRKVHCLRGADWLLARLTTSLSVPSTNRVTLSLTRCAALPLRTMIRKSSAYRAKRCPRFSNSLSSGSRTMLASNGESGPPCGTGHVYSGPPAYVFSHEQEFVSWSSDTGDDPEFRNRWPMTDANAVSRERFLEIVEPFASHEPPPRASSSEAHE